MFSRDFLNKKELKYYIHINIIYIYKCIDNYSNIQKLLTNLFNLLKTFLPVVLPYSADNFVYVNEHKNNSDPLL